VRIASEVLAASVWGTGYGSKRHLVDHEASQLGVQVGRFTEDHVTARCAPTRIMLDSLDGDSRTVPWGGITHAERVQANEPCARCLKLAR
jgi:hypothetical protein